MKLCRKIFGLAYRLILPIIDPLKFLIAIPRYFLFFIDLVRYNGIRSLNRASVIDLHPVLNDKTSVTSIDAAYFYQGVWAFEKILQSGVKHHTDIASQTDLVAYLSKVMKVTFVDIRPLYAKLDNFISVRGTITNLPFDDDSIGSLSCLHVVEHIGLGRYGDSLDPEGTTKAFRELKRVLAPGGNLYLSLPIGKERICFNAHRVTSPKTVLSYFQDLEMVEVRCTGDDGSVDEHPDIDSYEDKVYSMGFFHFRKPSA